MSDLRRVACQKALSSLLGANTRGLAPAVLDGVCQDLRIDPTRLHQTIVERYLDGIDRRRLAAPSDAKQAETIGVLTAQRDGLQAAQRVMRARLDKQAWAIRELWFGLQNAYLAEQRSKALAVCVHCDAVIGRAEADSHWRTCPKHPAGVENGKLREQLKETREVLHSLHMAIGSISSPDFKQWVFSWGVGVRPQPVQALENAYRAAQDLPAANDKPEG